MAAADCVGRRRFAAACGVLSRRVKAEAAKLAPTAPTMLLMPGADVAPDVCRGGAAEESPAPQLTIVYGGRVMVFDGVAADRAAELVRVAAGQQDAPIDGSGGDMPVARKASLQRFMEKRRDRLGARAPYVAGPRPSPSPAKAAKNGAEERDAGCWLELGIPGVSAAR